MNLERLRERIAAAINREEGCDDVFAMTALDRCRRLADAVIAELALEPQPHPGPEFAFHRWVTDWVADE